MKGEVWVESGVKMGGKPGKDQRGKDLCGVGGLEKRHGGL